MKRIELLTKRLEGVCSNPLSYMGSLNYFLVKVRGLFSSRNSKIF